MALRASHGGELPSRPVPRVQGVCREKYTHLAAHNSVPAWIFTSCMHWLPLTTVMLTTPLLPPRTIAPPVIALVFCRACSVLLLPPQIPYSSPVSVDNYPQHGVILTLMGLVATGGYFVYQMSAGAERKLSIEMVIAVIASVALGFGSLFLMLSFNLYV